MLVVTFHLLETITVLPKSDYSIKKHKSDEENDIISNYTHTCSSKASLSPVSDLSWFAELLRVVRRVSLTKQSKLREYEETKVF